MELNDIKDLVKLFNEIDCKTLFGALVVYETIDHIQDLEDFNEKDVEYLEKLCKFWVDSDIDLINARQLIEEYEERGGM